MDDTSPNTSNAPQVPATGSSSDSGTSSGPQTQAASPQVPAATQAEDSSPQVPAPNPAAFDPLANGPRPPALEPRLAAVAAIPDPHLRQHVEANVRLQTQRQISAFTEGQRQAKAQAKQVIDQGGDLSTIPAKLMLQIDTPGRQALRDYVLAHGNPATDPVTYYGLKNQALDDPAAFQAIDLSDHMARLKPADYAELQQLQTSLNSNQPPADLPLQQAYKANTDHMLRQFGLPTNITMPGDDTTGSDADDPLALQQALKFRQAADLELAANQVATGRQLTPAEHRTLLKEVSFEHQQPSTDQQSPNGAVAGATAAALGAEGVGIGDAAAGGATLLSELGLGGLATAAAPAAAFLAGMWPTPTAGPALDEAPQVHDVPDPENGVARSEDSDGPAGAEINESKKNYRRKRDAPKAKVSDKAGAAGSAAPPPDQQDPNDDQEEEQPVFKKPSWRLKIGDWIDIKRFIIRIGQSKGPPHLKDPKTGFTLQEDLGGHGESGWKLRDQFGEPIGTFSPEGKFMRLPSGWK